MRRITTRRVQPRFGEFGLENGYPTRAAATAVQEQLVLNQAVEVFLASSR